MAIMHMCTAAPVAGQTRGTFVPSIDLTTLYDDNVFVTARAPASDRVIRMSPALSAERHFPRGAYSGSYRLDAEQYARHHELTNPAARVQAFSRLNYTAGQRLRLGLDHGYTDTTAPTELNLGTALAAGRMRTTRTSGGSSATYRLSQRTTAVASHHMTIDRLEDGRSMRAHVSRAAMTRALSRRERFELDVEHSRFRSHSQSLTADAVRLGWTRAIGSGTHLQLRGGPRLTSGTASADLFALVSHASESTSISLSFEQAQTTVIGVEAPVEARSVQMRVRWSPSRWLSCTVTPGLFRSAFAGRDIDVVRMGLDLRYVVTKTMAIDGAYGLETQRGTVGSADTGTDMERLRHRTLSVAVSQQWK
jgi:hypothetical protein